ncbi:hypothetical protein ACGFYV_03975 [Streptomyces sp. NPDC048297]|uniref:hypothetical protein n=1 Tax=Streptomyces sp. NPDC048297 TaxID=3365531 RepID=UPI003716D716
MPATRTSRAIVTASAAALLCCAAAPATPAAAEPQPPMHMSSGLIKGGADGRPHEFECPAMQHLFSGGYRLSARPGHKLGSDPADVIENRANDNATGWIVTVRKQQVVAPARGKNRPTTGATAASAADLTIHVVCSDETMSHGA